ncbi:MAG: aminotransferase class I/II-fold pyridoxal phosphate-dependent enzyme [Anaerolineales bacterium]
MAALSHKSLTNFQPAARVADFGATVFAEIANLAARYDTVDLSTGYPDTDGPPEAMAAVIDALRAGRNQYTPTEGEPELRAAIAHHARRFYGQELDPGAEIVVTSGAAEALYSVFAALLEPGDEVVIVEPYYDVYVPDVLMNGGSPRFVSLHPPEWQPDLDELAAAFGNKTRAILINTPHNPTGRVLSRAELEAVAALCRRWNAIAVVDEVYEHLVYDGAEHVRLATLPGMFERTITISSVSKSFSFTGWRVGWVIAPPELARAVRLAHQYVADCAATPMQYGAAAALQLPDAYFEEHVRSYAVRRQTLMDALHPTGLAVSQPQGSYFILAGIEPLGYADDFEFCRHLIRAVGLAAIPPSAFFSRAHRHIGQKFVRFAFCKTPELLAQAAARLEALRPIALGA